MTMTYQHTPYLGTIGKWNMKYQKPYQGTITIGKWNMKYQRPYQGTISPNKLQHGRLYQGSIRRDAFGPQLYGKTADKNNPYRYYQLPPDYYGARRRSRMKPQSPAGKTRPPRDNELKPQTVKPAAATGDQHVQKQTVDEHTDRKSADKKVQKQTVDEHTDRKAADKKGQRKQTPKQITKETKVKKQDPPPVTAAPIKQPQKEKPLAKARKTPDPVSPFPPASPEPRKPANRRDKKITPEPVRVRSFTDVPKPEPVFPPIMPTTMEDYVTAERARKATPPRIRRNPLLPMAPTTEESAMANLLRYSRFSPVLSLPRDSYDSLSRSFTNVPGYNAVGSVLRSVRLYNH
ncbi:hypothetical protein BsWGS_14430 [Bradybaena similaris]